MGEHGPSTAARATALAVVGLAAILAAAVGAPTAAADPMADAGLDQTVPVGDTVHLDGTGSAAPEGTIEGYDWTITAPDGSEVEPECPECGRTTFSPASLGRYEVTLEVTGDDGATATDTAFVDVVPAASGSEEPSRNAGGERPREAEPLDCNDESYRSMYFASCVGATGPTYPPYDPADRERDDGGDGSSTEPYRGLSVGAAVERGPAPAVPRVGRP